MKRLLFAAAPVRVPGGNAWQQAVGPFAHWAGTWRRPSR